MIKVVPIKSFKKEPFSSNKVRARVLNEMKAQAKIAKAYLALTTEYWNDPPTFTEKIFYKNASPILLVGPDYMRGSITGAQHWIKVEEGTAIEHAIYTSDFKPKTEPGQLGGNVPGQGYVINRDDVTRPGIAPRNWIPLIQDAMRADFTISIGQAIKKGLESE